MPRGVRRRVKSKVEWSSMQRQQLVNGQEFFQQGFGRSPDHPVRPLNFAALREAWDELGPEILDGFIREHPFRRPWGWWLIKAPEARREADDGSGDNADDALGSPAWWAEHREEKPRSEYLLRPSRGCESFREYLTRLGLLTDHERELIRRERHRRANP